jgi:hypothetical protein
MHRRTKQHRTRGRRSSSRIRLFRFRHRFLGQHLQISNWTSIMPIFNNIPNILIMLQIYISTPYPPSSNAVSWRQLIIFDFLSPIRFFSCIYLTNLLLTAVWGPKFGDRSLGTEIWGPKFGDHYK